MSSGGDKIGRPEPVSTQVAALSFSFYTADEVELAIATQKRLPPRFMTRKMQVRSLSVKRITNPVMFDKLNNPLRDGLYDPAMGPTERKGVCATCKQDHVYCPGHFGRVELPVPVYNPVTFGTVVRLLRCVCFHCWRFRTKADKTALYVRKLQLLSEGRLAEALEISVGGKAAKALNGDSDSEEEEEEDAEMEEAGAAAAAAEAPPASGRGGAAGTTAAAGGGAKVVWTSLTYGEARGLIAQYLAKQPSKCENCGCHSPGLKAEGSAKILRMPLSAKARKANLGLGVDLEKEIRLLPTEEDNLEVDDIDAAAMDPETGARREPAEKGQGGDEDGSSSSDDDTSDDEEAAPAPKGGKKEPSGMSAKPAKAGAKKGAAAALEDGAQAKNAARLITPTEALAYLKRLWAAEHEWVSMCWAATPLPFGGRAHAPPPSSAEAKRRTLAGVESLFIRNLLVPPNKFRPPSVMDGVTYEHAQNTLFGAIIQASLQLTEVFKGTRTLGPNQEPLTVRQRAEMGLRAWLALQNAVNKLIDSAAGGAKGGNGIRQSLERKEGLFRMNMMGKRVNYAARSVISPDPYIMPNEVGVPPFVAKKLTITENVTPFNVAALRRAVENGPDVYPGAVAVENEQGTVRLLAGMPPAKRAGLAKALLAGTASGHGIGTDSGRNRATAARPPDGRTVGIKAVYRHMRDGDIMLTNRQPTLHKPGVMAHRARVLKGQRTIRLHYSNCATFNADFDGDEINLHLPQDQHGRAEAYNIVSADCQFTVPTDGKPIRGLIQDHIVSAVLLTKRDTFLDRAEFTNLLYFACLSLPGGNPRADPDEPYEKLRVFSDGLHIEIPPPAIMKPKRLYTGKQVLTALLTAIAKGRPPINCSAKTKVPEEYFGSKSGEDVLNVVDGEVVTGVLDKNAFGKYGLVHAVQELYGNADAGRMLSCLSRLCTCYLQSHGFTCGIDDMLLLSGTEASRKKMLATANDATHRAAEEFAYAGVAPVGEALRPSAVVREQLESRLRERAGAEAGLDMKSTGPLNKIASATIKECLPKGQIKAFPYNYLSLMTVSGAKGGPVNFAQISALLGQQELEGRRVPRMASGKTLPCFVPYDLSARAGGFIADRFLTGIKPQEYYFHCMAGREGLVDTAVKTSRSGYLQRCLVKNLEGLRVAYDSTVRDTDKSIVQFHYGEDGLDVTKVSYHSQFAFLASNAPCLRPALEDAGEFLRRGVDSGVPRPFGPPSLPKLARYDVAGVAGAVSDKFQRELDAFVEKSGKDLLRRGKKDGKKSKKHDKGAGGSEKPGLATEEEFRQLMALRYVAGLAAPGEAVGVIAAQSVGEPSTQMTLNTFHFAGRGEANVTLGIPRLREILMAAAKVIGTPVMTLPLRPEKANKECAEELAGRLRMIVFAELVSDLRVTERPFKLVQRGGGEAVPSRTFEVQCTVRAAGLRSGPKPRPGEATFDEVKEAFEREFLKTLLHIMKAELKRAMSIEFHTIRAQKAASERADTGASSLGAGGEEEEDGADAEDGGAQRGGPGAKGSQQADQEKDDEDESEEEDEEGAKADERRKGRNDAATTARDADDTAAAGEESSSSDEEEEEGGERRGGAGAASESESDEDAAPAAGKGGKGAGTKAKGGKGSASAAKGKGKDAKKPAARITAMRKSSGIVTSLDMVRNSVESDDRTGTLTATVALEIGSPKLLMLDIAQRAAAAAIVRQTPRIKKCYVLEEGGWRVQTDGVNFQAAWKQADLVDTSKIGSNDIYAMLQTFGVEACRATLLNEVRSVFGAYGIAVDARHLSLIADFMTHEGGYRPCSRLGMENNPSPFQKISFETATKFLADATMRGTTDHMESPSSRLVLGRVVELGTGTTQIVYDVDKALELQRERVAGLM